MLAALLVYVSFLSSQGIWFFLSPQNVGAVTLPSISHVTETKTRNRASSLSGFHLFGVSGQVVSEKKVETKSAPKTRLRLILKGVFTSEHGGKSGAIVEEIGKKSDYYSLGDNLPGNAVLAEVYSDRILLRRNGKLETLFFDDGKKTSGSQIAKVPGLTKKKKKPSRSKGVNSPEEFMSEAAKRLADNPDKALSSVGLSATEGGYVYQGGNPMLSGMNLKKGDVIRSVNGHPLGDVKKDKSLMKSFYEQGTLEVEIMRDGASFYVNYPLR